MPLPFASRAARLGGAIDKAFGESFTFLPFTSSSDVDLPAIPDVSRMQFDAVGVWDGPAKIQIPHARGTIQDDTAHGWAASLPSVCVQDALMPWHPRMRDRVRRRSDGSLYEISQPLPDGNGRTVFVLTSKKIR